jgi:hypothetical protein
MTGAHELHLHGPQILYRHWEESQWSPWEFDLSVDREQWAAMEDRTLLAFVLGSLMVAEERITTKFSGLVGAEGSEEEVTYLATQQVDEARHMQFYARASWPATAGSTATSSATSATASGSCGGQSPRSRPWATSFARPCASCSPPSPTR